MRSRAISCCWLVPGFVVFVLLFVGLAFWNNNNSVEWRRLSTHAGKSSVADMISSDPLLLYPTRAVHNHKSAVASKRTLVNDSHTSSHNASRITVTANTTSTVINNKPTNITTAGRSVMHDNNTQLFYMYPLDEEFWWRWPVDGADCSDNGTWAKSTKNIQASARSSFPMMDYT